MRLFFFKAMVVIVLFILPADIGFCARSEKRIKVDKVTFNGVSAFSPRRLSKLIITRASRIFSSYYYNEDIFLEDIKGLAAIIYVK